MAISTAKRFRASAAKKRRPLRLSILRTACSARCGIDPQGNLGQATEFARARASVANGRGSTRLPAARADRAAAPKPEPANALADPIFAAIDRLAKPETESTGQLLAIDLARIALAMPHSDEDALIDTGNGFAAAPKSEAGLLAAIALDGQVLDVDVVMQGR